MRIAVFSILSALMVGCATTPDPVDQLTARLSSSHGLWMNGMSPVIDLPVTASMEEVVTQVFQMTGFDRGHITSHQILKVRKVQIKGGGLLDTYTAVVVDTDFGRKIVLLKYEGPGSGWWSRVYDFESTAPPIK